MNRRQVLRWLLVLYPAWWRRHYGPEAAAILEEAPPSSRAMLDVLRGAADAWTRQRPPLSAFGRFNEGALDVVSRAQMEAWVLHHRHVGTEHILLGLLAGGDDPAARALADLGVSSGRVRERVRELLRGEDLSLQALVPQGRFRLDPPAWPVRLSPRAKRGFERSCRVADRFGEANVGAAHLLLGMLEEGEGIGVMILGEMVAPERVRERTALLMNR